MIGEDWLSFDDLRTHPLAENIITEQRINYNRLKVYFKKSFDDTIELTSTEITVDSIHLRSCISEEDLDLLRGSRKRLTKKIVCPLFMKT